MNLTEIICVLDRSGSMASVIDDAIGGFNTFLKEQKNVKVDKAKMSIIFFDDQYEIFCKNKDIENMQELNEETYIPRGMTALNDAIGKTIATFGEEFSKREESDKPDNVIMIIQTDGLENSSKEYTEEKVRAMIKEQEDQWKWKFIFLSSDLDAQKQGVNLGFSSHNISQYANTGVGTRNVYFSASSSVTDMRSKYSSEENQQTS